MKYTPVTRDAIGPEFDLMDAARKHLRIMSGVKKLPPAIQAQILSQVEYNFGENVGKILVTDITDRRRKITTKAERLQA